MKSCWVRLFIKVLLGKKHMATRSRRGEKPFANQEQTLAVISYINPENDLDAMAPPPPEIMAMVTGTTADVIATAKSLVQAQNREWYAFVKRYNLLKPEATAMDRHEGYTKWTGFITRRSGLDDKLADGSKDPNRVAGELQKYLECFNVRFDEDQADRIAWGMWDTNGNCIADGFLLAQDWQYARASAVTGLEYPECPDHLAAALGLNH